MTIIQEYIEAYEGSGEGTPTQHQIDAFSKLGEDMQKISVEYMVACNKILTGDEDYEEIDRLGKTILEKHLQS